jgi:RNA polymerase sigma-70 factor (ECF subfamily)
MTFPTATTTPVTLTANADEAALIARVKANDPAACEQLVRTYGGKMLSVARRFLKCDEDAADAVQDAFISAFRFIGSFEGQSKLGTWLHRIVVTTCLMRIRADKRHVSIEPLLPTYDESGHRTRRVEPWDAGALDHALTAEMRAQVRACIEQLPPRYREVVLLRDIEELDTEETARLLNCTPSNVKTRLHRARQALRLLLEPIMTG